MIVQAAYDAGIRHISVRGDSETVVGQVWHWLHTRNDIISWGCLSCIGSVLLGCLLQHKCVHQLRLRDHIPATAQACRST